MGSGPTFVPATSFGQFVFNRIDAALTKPHGKLVNTIARLQGADPGLSAAQSDSDLCSGYISPQSNRPCSWQIPGQCRGKKNREKASQCRVQPLVHAKC
jgi:hypothetical protein